MKLTRSPIVCVPSLIVFQALKEFGTHFFAFNFRKLVDMHIVVNLVFWKSINANCWLFLLNFLVQLSSYGDDIRGSSKNAHLHNSSLAKISLKTSNNSYQRNFVDVWYTSRKVVPSSNTTRIHYLSDQICCKYVWNNPHVTSQFYQKAPK